MSVRTSHVVLAASALALLATAGTSQAAITVYTSLAAFNAATSAPGTDTYAGFSITGSTPTPVVRAAGAYGYTATATPLGLFFGGGTTANPFLSTNTATDTILTNTYTGGGIVAVGGNFFASNVSGLYAAGNVTVVATDGSGSSTQVISPTSATAGSFLGFVSDGPMTSLSVASVTPTSTGANIWPSLDNFVLARAAIPEPTSLAAVSALAGTMIRRRRSV